MHHKLETFIYLLLHVMYLLSTLFLSACLLPVLSLLEEVLVSAQSDAVKVDVSQLMCVSQWARHLYTFILCNLTSKSKFSSTL